MTLRSALLILTAAAFSLPARAATVKGYDLRQVLVARAPARSAEGRTGVRAVVAKETEEKKGESGSRAAAGEVADKNSQAGARERDPDPRERMTVLLAGDRGRLEREDGTVVVVRLDRQEMVELDLLLRAYERRSFRELREQWRQLNALLLEDIENTPPAHPARAELVDRLDNGPEKWRDIWRLPPGPGRSRLIAKYNLPDEPPEIEVRRTRETRLVAGLECRVYESLEDGRARDRASLAESVPFDRRYYEFMELSGWIGPELAEGLKRARGLPLETTMRRRDGTVIELRTEAVTERELDTSLFEVPEGFRERRRRSTFR
jgi:hypothetical protein